MGGLPRPPGPLSHRTRRGLDPPLRRGLHQLPGGLSREGWYVSAAHRKSGVGRALIDAVIAWGRSQGCTEMASEATPDNEGSLAAHLAVGFDDAGLVRCFRRDL